MKSTFHEALYRTEAGMEKLRDRQVAICGAGALGANICESLARVGVNCIRLIDHDRVEQHNISTQPYLLEDVGGHKVDILASYLYRACKVEIDTVRKTLDERNVGKLLKGSRLVVDCFDNSASRNILTKHSEEFDVDCIHVGLASAYAEVVWNEVYTVPGPSQDDVCDYPLARNLVTLAVSVASEYILRFLISSERKNWSITLEDLAVREMRL